MYICLISIYVNLYRANWNNCIGMAFGGIDLQGSEDRHFLRPMGLCKDTWPMIGVVYSYHRTDSPSPPGSEDQDP